MTTNLLAVIQSLGDSFYHDLGLEKILVTVRDPGTLEIVQFERNRRTPDLRLRQGFAMVSESIRIRGQRSPIGQVEIQAAASPLKANDLMEVSETIRDLIQSTIEGNPAARAA